MQMSVYILTFLCYVSPGNSNCVLTLFYDWCVSPGEGNHEWYVSPYNGMVMIDMLVLVMVASLSLFYDWCVSPGGGSHDWYVIILVIIIVIDPNDSSHYWYIQSWWW